MPRRHEAQPRCAPQPSSCPQLSAAGCRLRAVGCGLRAVGCGLSAAGCRLSALETAGRDPSARIGGRYGCLPGARAPGRPATVDAWLTPPASERPEFRGVWAREAVGCVRDLVPARAGRRGRSPPTPPAGSHTAGLCAVDHASAGSQLRPQFSAWIGAGAVPPRCCTPLSRRRFGCRGPPRQSRRACCGGARRRDPSACLMCSTAMGTEGGSSADRH